MKKKVSSLDEIMAEYFCKILPSAEREYFGILKASVDVGVWLVGLSTGIIAVLMTSGLIRALLSEWVFAAGLKRQIGHAH